MQRTARGYRSECLERGRPLPCTRPVAGVVQLTARPSGLGASVSKKKQTPATQRLGRVVVVVQLYRRTLGDVCPLPSPVVVFVVDDVAAFRRYLRQIGARVPLCVVR